MESPIRALYEHVGTSLVTDTRSPVSPDGTLFDFTFDYPGSQSSLVCDHLMVTAEVEYFPVDEGASLEVHLRRMPRKCFKKPSRFFALAAKEIDFFLSSFYDSEEEDYLDMPEGWFYPRMREKNFITPAFSLWLGDLSREEIMPEFNRCLYYACSFLWLAAPLLGHVRESGSEPTAPERFRLLSIAHGISQVLLSESDREKGDPPPVFCFPKGLYLGRHCGDAIRHLRPQ